MEIRYEASANWPLDMCILYVCTLWLCNGEFSYTIDQFW